MVRRQHGGAAPALRLSAGSRCMSAGHPPLQGAKRPRPAARRAWPGRTGRRGGGGAARRIAVARLRPGQASALSCGNQETHIPTESPLRRRCCPSSVRTWVSKPPHPKVRGRFSSTDELTQAHYTHYSGYHSVMGLRWGPSAGAQLLRWDNTPHHPLSPSGEAGPMTTWTGGQSSPTTPHRPPWPPTKSSLGLPSPPWAHPGASAGGSPCLAFWSRAAAGCAQQLVGAGGAGSGHQAHSVSCEHLSLGHKPVSQFYLVPGGTFRSITSARLTTPSSSDTLPS